MKKSTINNTKLKTLLIPKITYFFTLILFMVLIQACTKTILTQIGNGSTQIDSTLPQKELLSKGWSVLQTGNNFYGDIVFYDENTGYLMTQDRLYKSKDGGLHWNYVPITFKEGYKNLNNQDYLNICVLRNKVFICTQGRYGALPYLLVVKEDATLDSIKFSDGIADIRFINQDTGYLVTSNSYYKSTDGGETWSLGAQLVSGNVSNLANNFPGSMLEFNSENHGWIGMKDSLFTISNNDSIQVVKMPTLANDWYWFSIAAPSDSTLFLATSNGLFRSLDGGKSISNTKFPFDFKGNIDLYFSDDNNGYLSSGNRIYKTVDGGNTWSIEVELNSETYIVEIDFKNPNLGWACCSNGQVLLLKR